MMYIYSKRLGTPVAPAGLGHRNLRNNKMMIFLAFIGNLIMVFQIKISKKTHFKYRSGRLI